MSDLRITAADLDREKPRLLVELANMFGRIPALGAMNVAREQIRPAPEAAEKAAFPNTLVPSRSTTSRLTGRSITSPGTQSWFSPAPWTKPRLETR